MKKVEVCIDDDAPCFSSLIRAVDVLRYHENFMLSIFENMGQ